MRLSECETEFLKDAEVGEMDSDLQLELESKIDAFLSGASPEERETFREWVKNKVTGSSSDSSESQPQKLLKRPFYR